MANKFDEEEPAHDEEEPAKPLKDGVGELESKRRRICGCIPVVSIPNMMTMFRYTTKSDTLLLLIGLICS